MRSRRHTVCHRRIYLPVCTTTTGRRSFSNFTATKFSRGDVDTSDTFRVAARMEQKGKLKCIITGNIYGYPQKAGCRNVINLHGSIHENICPHCGRKYPLEYIRASKKVPLCEDCSRVIRPQVALFGEMMDSQLMTRSALLSE